MLLKEKKLEYITKYQKHEKDTGSAEVQIVFLTEKINNLSMHLKNNRKDYSSLRGLMKLIGKRRSFLNYLKKKSEETYKNLISNLNIRK